MVATGSVVGNLKLREGSGDNLVNEIFSGQWWLGWRRLWQRGFVIVMAEIG